MFTFSLPLRYQLNFIFILTLKTCYSKHNFAHPKLQNKTKVGSEKVKDGAYLQKGSITKVEKKYC